MQVNAAVTSACLVELIDTLWNVNALIFATT